MTPTPFINPDVINQGNETMLIIIVGFIVLATFITTVILAIKKFRGEL